MTFNRSVVAAPDEAVALRVLGHSGRAAVSVDGQLRGVLDPGDWIGVYAAPRRLRVVRLGPTDFYGRLRERMRLTDAPAADDTGVTPVAAHHRGPRRPRAPASPAPPHGRRLTWQLRLEDAAVVPLPSATTARGSGLRGREPGGPAAPLDGCPAAGGVCRNRDRGI